MTALTLTGCDDSGKIELPNVPPDIRKCFDEVVGPFPAGPINQLMLFDKLAEFLRSDKVKSACGKRLIAIIDASHDPRLLKLKDKKKGAQ
ncbi:hypothetical protein [Mesorhizobium sp. STM 4661]|uniref:hypothetical protein n=1 Tax=Mesorhizobium sp. STM 4661 TaxID=1297570 RepID=UPI0018DEDA41|nr:hypothetical protein [Mesorhizobium sp. STM 4661]